MSDPLNLVLPEDPEPQDPWLMTFADMVSLLFAFFVILYSMSAVNASRYKDLQEALRDSFKGKPVMGKLAKELNMDEMLGSAKEVSKSKTLENKVNDELNAITTRMNAYINEHNLGSKVSTFIDERGVVIKIADDILFSPGDANLSQQSNVFVNYLVGLIKEFPYPLRVEGHTDNTPIQTSTYPSNWELSTARACNVVRTFIERGGTPSLFSAEGFAEYRPIASNTTASGKTKNRRVELIYKKESVAQAIKNNANTTPSNNSTIPALTP